MTAWLPIETYPYDGTLGLLRGGLIMVTDNAVYFEKPNVGTSVNPSVVIGFSTNNQEHESDPIFIMSAGKKDIICYLGPTEWLPLRALDDLVDDAYVNGLRITL